jgi:hypothetical protein
VRPAIVTVGAFILAAGLSACSSSGPANSLNAGAICGLVNSTLFYPTIPRSGEHISTKSAMTIEAALRKAASPALRSQSAALQQAIDRNDEAQMLSVVSHIQKHVCPPLGSPPVT